MLGARLGGGRVLGRGILHPVTWINWAGDERFTPATVVRPRSVEELSVAVRDAGERTVRVAGAGHSFGDLVATDGVLLQLDGLADVLAVDRAACLVRVGAGIRLHALNAALDALGLALPNLGDIDRQSVAGAISTATHGTGARLGNLATQVEELELVLADGSVLRCAPCSDELRAARVSLGALGVLATVTLRVVPAFRLRGEDRAHPLAGTLARLDEHVAGADHFEFYVFPHSDLALTRTNTRTEAPAAPRGRLRRFLDEELVPNDLLGAVCRLGRRFPAALPRVNQPAAGAVHRDGVGAAPRGVRAGAACRAARGRAARRELPDRGAVHRGRRGVVPQPVMAPGHGVRRGARVRGHAVGALLPRGAGRRARPRRPPAL